MVTRKNEFARTGKAQHVFQRYGGAWSVRKTGSERSSRIFSTQKEAVDHARTIAKKYAGDVFIHRQDGRIASYESYGRDPLSPKK